MTFGADITRYGRSPFVWAHVYAAVDNHTWPVLPPKRFLSPSKAHRWADRQVVELRHQEAQAEFHRQMAALTNGASVAA